MNKRLMQQARECVSRGWCEPETALMQMDSVLAEAIARHVAQAFAELERVRRERDATRRASCSVQLMQAALDALHNQLTKAKEREDMLMAEVQGACERVAELERELEQSEARADARLRNTNSARERVAELEGKVEHLQRDNQLQLGELERVRRERVEFGGGRTGGKTVMLTTPDSRIERWNGIQVTHRACGLCRHFVQHMRPDGDQVRLSVTGRCAAHSMPGVDIIVFEHMACADFALGERE